MRKKGFFLTSVLLVGLLLFSGCALISMQFKLDQEFGKIGINFSNKESILRLEKDPGLFKFWVNWDPIKYLMVPEEKKLVKKILKIQDESEKNLYVETFIEWFWARRDDNSYDDENEFKGNFYNRVIEAQTRFADKENATTLRKCKYGRGWRTDMGLMYILLGEPFDKSRQDVEYLMKFFNSSYQGSALMPQEIEIWYYEVSEFDEEENYNGWFFQDGVAWLFFEKDFIYWQFGEKTLGLFYNYENYYQTIMFGGSSITYATYIGEVYRFIDAAAKGYIYDKDLTFEEMFIEWVPIKKD